MKNVPDGEKRLMELINGPEMNQDVNQEYEDSIKELEVTIRSHSLRQMEERLRSIDNKSGKSLIQRMKKQKESRDKKNGNYTERQIPPPHLALDDVPIDEYDILKNNKVKSNFKGDMNNKKSHRFKQG